MKNYFVLILVASAATILIASIRQKSQAQERGLESVDKSGALIAEAVGVRTNNEETSPIYGVTVPDGYRDWKVIAVDQLLIPDKADQLRAQLGNDIAIKAFKEGKLPFPDGAMIVAIHWTRVPSEDNNKVLDDPFPGAQSFLIGSRVNMQVMVKDSKKYVATGGWGFADFKDGKPGSQALHETCFPCHAPAKDRDYVITHYAL